MSVCGLPLFSRFIRYDQHDSGELPLTIWSKLYVTSVREKLHVIKMVKVAPVHEAVKISSLLQLKGIVAFCQGDKVPSNLKEPLVCRSVVVESAAAWSSQGQCSGLTAGG